MRMTIMMKKTIMKKLTILSVMLVTSITSWAELPSWGMTENQYKLDSFSNKMSEIGAQAYKNNWLLKITAPNDWHNAIRNALTKTGERDVQFTFKDSLYQSIAISAVPGAKTAKISPSTGSESTVQKQVVIDKPEIDTMIEAPDFGDTDFKNNTNELLQNISAMEIAVPKAQVETSKPLRSTAPAVVKTEKSKAVAEVAPVTTAQSAPQAVSKPVVANDNVNDNKEELRKRHARNKRIEKQLSYSNINGKDELFIKNSVVLIKRFLNQGIVVYYWMRESYDPTVHQFVEKSTGKYKKDPVAIEAEISSKKPVVVEKKVEATNLNFIAIDSDTKDQDDLRKEHIRNKRVKLSISASKLKEKDVLYVKNKTVLVVRPLTGSQSNYFWLVGDTTISREVERKGDNQFMIK